ncbi:hypothetical protein LINPERHAP2_LOCUS6452 [Linum perenne]
MVLRSKDHERYMHYLWNDEFGDYYKYMGCKRELDVVSPFVKLEVVASIIDPTRLIHLRCSCNNKFLKLSKRNGVFWVSATGDEPVEEVTKGEEPVEGKLETDGGGPNSSGPTSTLFEPVFPPDEPDSVGFMHVESGLHMRTFSNQTYSAEVNDVVCVYTHDDISTMHRFEYKPWVSYEEVVRAHKEEVRRLRDRTVSAWEAYEEKARVEDEEIEELKERMKSIWGEYDEKMKGREERIRMLRDGILSAWDTMSNGPMKSI